MKKTLIAAGIAAVVAAPAAFAEVSVSGVVEQQMIKTDGSAWTGSSDNSLTFKASEDLGNGMTAFASITIDTDTSTTNDRTKDQVVGLKGGFGMVMTGRFEDFTEGKVMSRMTLEGDGGAGGGAVEGGANASRTNNGVAYVSPTVNGFHVGVGAFAGASAGSATFDAVDIALFYDNGPLSIAVAHETSKDSANSPVDEKQLTAAVSYTMGDLKGTIVRAKTSDEGFSAGDDQTDMMYRIDYKMGNNSISIAHLDDETTNGANGNDTTALELSHNFSKRTKAYVTFTSEDNANSDTTSIGLKHKF